MGIQEVSKRKYESDPFTCLMENNKALSKSQWELWHVFGRKTRLI